MGIGGVCGVRSVLRGRRERMWAAPPDRDPGSLPSVRRRGYDIRPMAQIREIKKRMVAVGTIQRITKTMQMIATAKFTAALQRAQATKPYTATIRRLVGELSAAAGDVSHPLIEGPAQPTKRELVFVISSDRGLCGAYNGNVLRTALRHIQSTTEAGTEVELHTAGKKAGAFFAFQKLDVAKSYTLGDNPKYDEVDAIASSLIDRFVAGEFDAIRICSMRFISNSRQVPELLQLLPLKPDAVEADAGSSDAGNANFEFSPSSTELLADLLPLSVKSQVFQCVNDAVVSEQVMRMIAMKAATDNAGELKHSLKIQFNRARQAQITTELTEIISGAAALE